MDILIKYPTRRTWMVEKTLAAWRVPGVRFLVTIDEDDEKANAPEFRAFLDAQPNLKYSYWPTRSKVTAINAGLEGEPFDLLILASDDMIPTTPRYAEIITELFAAAFPDGDGVLHLNDGRNGRRLNTLPVIGRKYYERFGYIYSPAYTSLYCDNEFQAVSERLGKSVYYDEVLIKHEWINVTGKDDLHMTNESHYADDGATFRYRESRGFPVETA